MILDETTSLKLLYNKHKTNYSGEARGPKSMIFGRGQKS